MIQNSIGDNMRAVSNMTYAKTQIKEFKGFVVKVSPIYKANRRNLTVLAKIKDFRGNYISVEAIHKAADALIKGGKGEIATLTGYWFKDSDSKSGVSRLSFVAYNGNCKRWHKRSA